MKSFSILATVLLLASIASAKDKKPAPLPMKVLRCGTVVHPANGQVQHNVLITVEGERILEVAEKGVAPAGVRVIVLSDRTGLPGLIDSHTHVLLQGDITAADYDEQLLKQSTAYRTILGTRSVKRALEYGFTTIRDVETEGAGYADVDLKKAINNGIIPRPRMRVATRAMDVTGAYPLQRYSWQIELPHGVHLVDCPDDPPHALRAHISH